MKDRKQHYNQHQLRLSLKRQGASALFRALPARLQSLHLGPRIHMAASKGLQLQSGRLLHYFWPPQAPSQSMIHIHTYGQNTYIHKSML